MLIISISTDLEKKKIINLNFNLASESDKLSMHHKCLKYLACKKKHWALDKKQKSIIAYQD